MSGNLSPPFFEPPPAAGIEIDIDNSSGTGIFMFGGWVFPVDGSADRGHIKMAIRDDTGDTITLDDEYAAIIDPPDYTMQTVVNSVSEAWTAGDTNFGTSVDCLNIGNGARIEKAAGVAATFTMNITIKINVTAAPNTCPGGGGPSGVTFFEKTYDTTVRFSG